MNDEARRRHQTCMRAIVLCAAALLFGCASSSPNVTAPVASATCNSVDDCAAEVARDPTDPRLRVRWGRALETAGRAAAAAREFRAAIRLAVDPAAPIDDAAEGLLRLGDPSGCVSELDTQLASADHMPTLAAVLRRARERCAEAARKTGA